MPTDVSARGGASRGRGVRIAVIDSGVHSTHPHVNGVAGGVAVSADGRLSDDYVDRIGHGTAVMAAIKEKAPDADCFAVRIFDGRLTAAASTLLAALEWAVAARGHIVNLSLGTSNEAHAGALESVVARAVHAGVTIVAARDDEGVRWWPGSLPGVVGVRVDWECERDWFHGESLSDGGVVFRASGFARPVPGVDPRRNLHGISFAVANVTGLLARAMSVMPRHATVDPVTRLLWFSRMQDSQDEGRKAQAPRGGARSLSVPSPG